MLGEKSIHLLTNNSSRLIWEDLCVMLSLNVFSLEYFLKNSNYERYYLENPMLNILCAHTYAHQKTAEEYMILY